MGLPEQYNTSVGAVGGQLSGGQKQRIAIARAIVRQPKLLILDEATSALDRKSEMEVQAALDALMRSGVKRTVLVIAHRLVTIQNVDTIHYITNDALDGSKLAESGSYHELIAKKGQFAAMASRQSRSHATKHDDEEDDEVHTAPAQQDAVMRRTGSAAMSTVIQVDGKKKMSLAEQAEHEVATSNGSTFRVAKMSADTLWAVAVGLLGSLMSGGVMPAYSIILSQMLTVLAKNDKDKIPMWACMFLVVAAAAFLGWTLQGFHAFTGEKLTKKLRVMAFRNMLRQDQTFFDMPGRDPGGLQGILSGDCEAVHQLWGPSLGYKIQMMCALSAGLIIGFVFSWKLALLALSGVPVLIMAGVVQQMFITGFGKDGDNDSSVVTETFTNIRTVMSFNAQMARYRMYCVDLDKKEKKGIKTGFVAGIAFGVTQFSMFGMFALCFWYGGKLIAKGELDFADVMTASTGVLMGSMGAGEAGGFLSKVTESAKASQRVFAIIDRLPIVDIQKKGDTQIGEADIELRDLRFIYPARESAVVLKNFNSRLPARGQYGLMGSTGCGKSTIIQLLARFYQPTRGMVSVGGKDLQSLDLRTWRSQVSAVFQEPALFSGTVRDNIAYSRPDATDAEVEDAARLAGIHEDVMQMEAGYRTQVGYKGRMLSGGQKQRVAIARGLLRRPKLLLLDEATSALDNATEARVQDGILEAHRRHPMTIVSVAHRLTTIRHSDRIILLDDGVLLEAGTHDELVALDGEYKKRWDLFQLDTDTQ
jgi:ATP-binding cassette subfamily B (MDR/TAP) protein 1